MYLRRACSLRGGMAAMSGLVVLMAIAAIPTISLADSPASADAHAQGSPDERQASVQAPADPSPNLTGDWAARKRLAEQGVSFDVDFISDTTRNLRGGLDTAGTSWRRMFEATLTLDTKPLLGIEGGTIFADFQYAQGSNASDKLIGDIQGIDGLDGVPGLPHQNRTQLSQLWYQQIAFDGALRIKAGKIDANNDFDHSPTAQEFLHQSTGSSATLFTLPTYPDPATGLTIFLKPNKDTQIGFAIFDGSGAEGVHTGSNGPRTFFRNAQDLFLIAEIDQTWELGKDHLPGRLGVGGWYSTNHFQRMDSAMGAAGRQVTGTGGPYLLLDQTIWRADPKSEKDGPNIAVFLMYGYGDPTILPYDHGIGGGLAWTGALPNRPDDILGVGVQAIHFGDAYRADCRFETSYEVFYRIQIAPWMAIKPDLQYISNPGGRGTADAVAVTLRIEMHF